MKKIEAIIERTNDGTYSIYSNADNLDYLITATGKTVAEAKQSFEAEYEDMKKYYVSEGKPFTEVQFVYNYDTASLLSYLTKAFSLAGLSRIMGINQGQLSHYINGRRTPSERTKIKMQQAFHNFTTELSTMNFI